MTDETVPINLEDPPNPDLGDLQQRDLHVFDAIPVTIEGTVNTALAPARFGHALAQNLTTAVEQVLGADLRRAKTTMICDTAWTYGVQASSCVCPWPANVPLVVTHSGPVYAKGTAGKVLTVISELYGD